MWWDVTPLEILQPTMKDRIYHRIWIPWDGLSIPYLASYAFWHTTYHGSWRVAKIFSTFFV
jgi:hypothetical protein